MYTMFSRCCYLFTVVVIVQHYCGIMLWQYAPKRKLIKKQPTCKTARMILDKSWDHPSNPLFKELTLVTFTIPYYFSCIVARF